jgi:hypothetical protein
MVLSSFAAVGALGRICLWRDFDASYALPDLRQFCHEVLRPQGAEVPPVVRWRELSVSGPADGAAASPPPARLQGASCRLVRGFWLRPHRHQRAPAAAPASPCALPAAGHTARRRGLPHRHHDVRWRKCCAMRGDAALGELLAGQPASRLSHWRDSLLAAARPRPVLPSSHPTPPHPTFTPQPMPRADRARHPQAGQQGAPHSGGAVLQEHAAVRPGERRRPAPPRPTRGQQAHVPPPPART